MGAALLLLGYLAVLLLFSILLHALLSPVLTSRPCAAVVASMSACLCMHAHIM
jgi:hypothetical protein